MKIAILSFGGLLKKGSGLVKSKWTNKNGPTVPIELCRISKSGRLVLAVNEEKGVGNEIYFATASGSDLNKVVPKFLEAENIGENQVGIIDLANKSASPKANKYPTVSRGIAQWAKKAGFEAVVVNFLGIKFKHEINVPFSVQNALNYIKEQSRAVRKTQVSYLKNIPASIHTPVLDALQEVNKKKAPAKAVKKSSKKK